MTTHTYTITFSQKTRVLIGQDLLKDLASILAPFAYTSITLVFGETTKKLFGEEILNALSTLCVPMYEQTLKDGEESKSPQNLLKILTFLAKKNVDRKGTVIGIGGGVIGDVTTVAASLYYRGIDCIQIPTTLLSQVDAALGGKGAVNLGNHKNTIGVIKQPSLVIIDTAIVKYLPQPQLLSGAGEIAKYAIAVDKQLFEKLETLAKLEEIANEEIIETCVKRKMSIVQKDPLDQGQRTILNFGHTLGHAIELVKHISHGEAVAIGMSFAIRVSHYQGFLSKMDGQRAVALLKKFGLQTTVSGINKETVYQLMQKDKKAKANSIKFVLLEEIGKVKIDQEVPKEIVDKVLAEVIV